jgi:adenylate kinase
MKKIIVVTGTLCSGKNAHSKLLAKNLNYKYCYVNDIVNEEIKNKTKIGLILEKYLNSGTKEPDEYLTMLIKEIIINLKEDGIVFNGFPKTVGQAKALDSFLFARKIKKPISIFLDTESVVSLKRLVEKTDQSFNEVMNAYEKRTKPVIDYYAPTRIVFDTSKEDIENVNEEIVKNLKEKCLLG